METGSVTYWWVTDDLLWEPGLLVKALLLGYTLGHFRREGQVLLPVIQGMDRLAFTSLGLSMAIFPCQSRPVAVSSQNLPRGGASTFTWSAFIPSLLVISPSFSFGK